MKQNPGGIGLRSLLPHKRKFALKKFLVKNFVIKENECFFTFYCNHLSLISAMGFYYSCTFHFRKSSHYRLFEIFYCFQNSWKLNILFIFKFQKKSHTSDNNKDVNITVQGIENDSCEHEYLLKLLQMEEIEESVLVLQFK